MTARRAARPTSVRPTHDRDAEPMTEGAYFPFEFEGALTRFGVGKSRKVWYTVLFLPPALESALPFADFPRLRVDGEIADVPVNGAWMPTGDGRRYFIVSPRVLKDAGATLGSRLEMRFRIADQNAVDVPAELTKALARNAAARKAWATLTPGKQRGFTHHIHAARTDATRLKRVRELLDALEDGSAR